MMRTDWKKITDEAFSSSEQHDFSDSYCRRRAQIQGGELMDMNRSKKSERMIKMSTVATFAACLAIPVVTVGALHMMKKTAAELPAPEQAAEVTEAASEDHAEPSAGAENVVYEDTDDKMVAIYYAVRMNYVPDYLEFDGCDKYYRTDTGDRSGIILSPRAGIYGDLGRLMSCDFNGTGSFDSGRIEDYTIGEGEDERHVYISYRSDNGSSDGTSGWFNRDVIITFAKYEGYTAGMSVHSSIPDEDLRQMIESVELYERTDPCFISTSYFDQYMDYDEYKDKIYVDEPVEYAYAYNYRVNYLPEGFTDVDGKYHKDSVYGGITPYVINYDIYGGDKDRAFYELFNSDMFSSDYVEEFTVGEGENERYVHVSHRIERQYDSEELGGIDPEEWKMNGWFDRDVVIEYPGIDGYAVGLFVHSSISEEDMIEFIKCIDLEAIE